MVQTQRIKNRGFLFSWDTFGDYLLNLYLIKGANRNYIIDSGLGSACIEPIAALLEAEKPIILINTHCHWDHVWGNAALEKATIISHTYCYRKLEEEWDAMLKKHEGYRYGVVQKRLPDMTFNSELYFPDDMIRLFHTPGHTVDSISILDEAEGVLNCGDNVGDTLEEIIPSIYDTKAHYIDSLRNYQKLDFDTVISGHNQVLGRDVISNILSIL